MIIVDIEIVDNDVWHTKLRFGLSVEMINFLCWNDVENFLFQNRNIFSVLGTFK